MNSSGAWRHLRAELHLSTPDPSHLRHPFETEYPLLSQWMCRHEKSRTSSVSVCIRYATGMCEKTRSLHSKDNHVWRFFWSYRSADMSDTPRTGMERRWCSHQVRLRKELWGGSVSLVGDSRWAFHFELFPVSVVSLSVRVSHRFHFLNRHLSCIRQNVVRIRKNQSSIMCYLRQPWLAFRTDLDLYFLVHVFDRSGEQRQPSTTPKRMPWECRRHRLPCVIYDQSYSRHGLIVTAVGHWYPIAFCSSPWYLFSLKEISVRSDETNPYVSNRAPSSHPPG